MRRTSFIRSALLRSKTLRVWRPGEGEPLQRMTRCVCASREIGANQGIDQFANWSMHTPPACATLIRVPASDKKRDPPHRGLFFWLSTTILIECERLVAFSRFPWCISVKAWCISCFRGAFFDKAWCIARNRGAFHNNVVHFEGVGARAQAVVEITAAL